MIRTLLILTVLAVLPHSLANAEFAIDEFETGFFGAPSTFSVEDDFGNDYSIQRTVTSSPGSSVLAGVSVSLADGDSVRIDYDFLATSPQSPSSTFALGFYASDFQIEGLNVSPNDSLDITVIGERQNGTVGLFTVQDVNSASESIFFDLTNLSEVGVLNDLASLSFVFQSDNADGTVVDFQNFVLVATPEPTSAASFGLLSLIGLLGSTRRRKK